MTKFSIALAAAFAVAPIFSAYAQTAASQPAPRAWLQCRACHTIKAGEANKVGPNLNKVFGARAGAIRPNFVYSPALKSSGIVWNEKTLDTWLINPAKMVRGNRMAYPGLADPVQRKALIGLMRQEGP